MAEIERTEHGDSGKTRAWTLRAVRARLDPAWTADGYVSERWRPVSPVTGRLDAFQWTTPVASLPSSDKTATIETSPFEEAMLAAPAPRREIASSHEGQMHEGLAEPPRDVTPDVTAPATQVATQDNAPPVTKPVEPPVEKAAEPVVTPAAAPAPATPSAESPAPAAAAPLFRTRADLSKPASPIPAVIPIVRAPDDPGIDDEGGSDEFAEQIGTPKAQAGGWRGFLARWGG
jgi:HemY protein